MYRLSSTSRWYHNQRFESLASALIVARKIQPIAVTDVVRDVDRDFYRVVWTFGNSPQGITLRK